MQSTHWDLNEESPFEKYRDMTALPDLPELNASLEKLKKSSQHLKNQR